MRSVGDASQVHLAGETGIEKEERDMYTNTTGPVDAAEMRAEMAALRAMLAATLSGGGSARGAGTRITVADLADKTMAGLTPNTKRTYGSYLRFLADGDPGVVGLNGEPWAGMGARWADEILPSDLEQVLLLVDQRQVKGAMVRAENREAVGRVVRKTDGSGARANAVGAWRRMFQVAMDDRHLAEGMSPAARVKKPKRDDGVRMALEDEHFEQMEDFFATTGDDPVLDTMVLRFLNITGARREGVLNLDIGGIDAEECTVRLDEKFGKVVDQPVPDWFIDELLAFARSRGSVSRLDKVFVKRTASGAFKAISARRFNNLFGDRLQASYVWADRQQVTAHTVRHHTITRMERRFGIAVATTFARHKPEGVTLMYGAAKPEEVAIALVEIFGGDHPWLHRPRRERR